MAREKAVFTPSSGLLKEIKRESGENVNLCFQCRKCASGCPVAYEMDLSPSEIIHAARLGMKDKVFNSKTVWLCASCQTCTTRCPQGLDIAKVMDAIKIMSVRAGVSPAYPDVLAFYKAALTNIRSFGRMYELGMIVDLKFRTLAFTKDMGLGMKMFMKGKLKIVPSFTGAKAARKIFENVKQREKQDAETSNRANGGH